MVVRLINKYDQLKARELIEESGFTFEEKFDAMFGVFEDGELVATASRDHNVFKMICIRDSHQGGTLLGELLTELINSCEFTNINNYFVFTKADRCQSFQHLNFYPLVQHEKLCLLEYGHGLQAYLDLHRDLVVPGNNGAVVVNCNPFTRGHQYLIEEAASQVDQLYVFVVREDRSIFPFDVRFRLAQQGTAHIPNVTVLDTSDYAISQVTFPGYFLKQDDDRQTIQMEVDLHLFGKHIAPFFNVSKRFIGTEPYCRTTRIYSETMHKILALYDIETVQLERKCISSQPISASRVREALKREAFETLKELVPDSTLAFLRSAQARELLTTLKDYQRRH